MKNEKLILIALIFVVVIATTIPFAFAATVEDVGSSDAEIIDYYSSEDDDNTVPLLSLINPFLSQIKIFFDGLDILVKVSTLIPPVFFPLISIALAMFVIRLIVGLL